MATFMERLAFLQKVPTLMKATADDETPCPGYLFQEIGKISHESSGCGQCLLEYLLERLQVESCHVKLKVLKIFVHLCGHGPSHFLTELRRNSTFIQQASVYSGPPDPVHGTALYQKVRNTAQDVARLLFTDVISTKNSVTKSSPALPAMGMGSAASHRSMQGFGYSSGKQGTGSDSLLDKIQKAAEVVASAVLPPAEQQGIRLHDNYYRAVAVPSAPIEVAVPACAYNVPARRPKASLRCPGQVGGGWEETDSSNGSSNNSSQDMAAPSKSAGTGSRSGASRESSGDLSERVEALQLGDCAQEVALINQLTTGSRVFLCREESQHFIKECSTLNCEVVVELLSNKLLDPSLTVKMRALCAVACLMTSDLIFLEQMFKATQRRLHHLAEGPPGPVANKATKMLRQFEALLGGGRKDEGATVSELHSSSTLSEHLLHTLSGEDTDLTRNHPDISPTVVTHTPNYTTTSFTESLSCSTEEIENGPVLPARTAKARDDPGLNTLSLFSGMELVIKHMGPCSPQTSRIESEESDSRLRHSHTHSSDSRKNTSLTGNKNDDSTTLISDHSQSASAFSFLHF
ncbi:AP-4 complex accessory subunit tepsin isoform X2 [Gouania willdenowi]|uniref:ENTH domain-containing protein n=1 Tax=Gouania willdenowi TaxID=441366 RepID=A0A8C5EPM4_GOUWI|nr:AP-4 complex accessory subunit tepsin isoform X2 [Gouania willdenowi]